MPDLQSEKVCLVIPCHNEARRLDLRQFTAAGSGLCFLFVDDGSDDATSALITPYLSERIHLLRLKENSGKAEAVRQGMLHVRSLPVFALLRWVGYWDADLAVPLSEVAFFLAYARLYEGEVMGIVGSRVLRLGSVIKRYFFRHLYGRLFATAASLLLGIKVYDSQCGAKLFRKELIEPYFTQPFVSRWIFDLELLLRMRSLLLIECPLRQWQDVAARKNGSANAAG